MAFRWDWLSPVLRAPYVPALGPVRPGALSAELFDSVVAVAGTGEFLPYDKDRRWSQVKDEHVLASEIVHSPGLTVIPTRSAQGRGTIKIHHYGLRAPDLADLAAWSRQLCARHDAQASQAVWLSGHAAGARTRLMLKTYHERDQRPPSRHVGELARSLAAATFPAFAAGSGEPGFEFLNQRIGAGLDDGPVLVAVDDERIVGAVGPLAVLADATGTLVVPPQYYAVLPGYRRRGHGRALWHAAIAWGAQHGATCKILQAAAGGAAERLYQSEGLATLGFVCRQPLS